MTWPILLLALGLLLIVGELMFPTFGALGVTAALCIIGAVAWAFAIDTTHGLAMLAGTAIGVPIAITAGMKLLPRSPLGRVLVNPGATFEGAAAVDARDAALLGGEGVAESLLRPAGTGRFGTRRVDVVTRGEAIEAGTAIRVIEVSGNRVVVTSAAHQVANSPR